MNKIALLVLAFISFSFVSKDKKFEKRKDYVFVPSREYSIGNKTESINAFWMAGHEVTNAEYRQFLNHLLQKGERDAFIKAVPDTAGWKTPASYLEVYYEVYFSHPAYADYPVVNISKEGAEMYCEYLTEQMRAIYGNQISGFRLPTRTEWMYAASGGNDGAIYSWGGPEVRNENGDYLANFRKVYECNIQSTENGLVIVPDSIKTEVFIDLWNYEIVAPANSYWPNDFGLYNMCGNVAELVSEEGIAVGGDWHLPGYDIRIQSTQKFTEPNRYTGFRPVMSFMQQDK